MNSSRPYLIRAIHDWIKDNKCTTHILVNSNYPGVVIPNGFATDGQIVLNISAPAIRALAMNNEAISFEGRFNGVPEDLYIPCMAVLGIYARENGQGMVFELEPEASDDPVVHSEPVPRPSGPPKLSVVK